MDELTSVYVQESREQLAEMEAGLLRLEQTPDDRDTINAVLAGFGADLLDEDKTPLEFTEFNLDRLLEVNGCAQAIVSSFFKHYAEQPAKN